MARNGATGPLARRGDAGEEVDIKEPELRIGLIPRVPAEQADGKGCGHLHVGGGAAGKADNAGAGDGDEGGVKVAAAAKAPHVEIDEGRHDEGETSRGQARAPVVDAEILKDEHGAPVVEGGFLEPGASVEIGSDAGAEPLFESVGGIEADEHLVGDLGIARLVGADQAEAIAAEPGA